tara:strand:- start:451 stop:636 length:186 start_codon:yes stop_codon:yes gene_type:complete
MARKKKEQLYQVEKRFKDTDDSSWGRQKGRLTQEQAEAFIAEKCAMSNISETTFRIVKDNG